MNHELYRARRHERILWCVFFAVWIGANVVALYAIEEWDVAEAEKLGVSRSALRDYRVGDWSGQPESQPSVQRLPYRVHEPKDTTTPQPLLLYLHGSGSRGSDNLKPLRGPPDQFRQTDWQARNPGFILVPQCPEGSFWPQELPSLIALVERWRNDPRVDKQRIYVTGASMGGYGTWHLMAARPEWFAAAVPVCGGGDPNSAEAIGPVPIWAVHGDADASVPVSQTRTMIEALRSIGASPQYSELKGVGHDSWTDAYSESAGILAWMFRQRNDRCPDCRSKNRSLP